MIDRQTPEGTPVEVEFRDGWYGSYEFVKPCGAIDREYRVIVRGNGNRSGQYLDGIDPACVREAV